VLSRAARTWACVGLLGLGVAVAVRYPLVVNSLPERLLAWYPIAIAVTMVAYGLLMRDRRYLGVAAASLAAWLAYSGMQSYQQLRRILTGLDQIAWGLLFFLIATAISLE
jgi:hypothetical protein